MEKSIKSFGRILDTGVVDINTSDIYSTLIRECGRWVECYNSDLLVDIARVNKILADHSIWKDYSHYSVDEETGDEVCLFQFGFRQYGVDHIEYIECNKDNPYYYRSLWELRIVAPKHGVAFMHLTRIQ